MRAARVPRRPWGLAIVIALVGSAAGASAAWRGGASDADTPAKAYRLDIRDPSAPGPYREWGLHFVRVDTDLPEGTLLFLEENSRGSKGTGIARVERGSIQLQPNNNECTVRGGKLLGTVLKIRITAAPTYDTTGFRCGFTDCLDLQRQPPHVENRLGRDFEMVRGPQLVQGAGGRRLVASRTIRLPAKTCFGFRISPRLVPYPRGAFERCPDLEGTLPVSREMRDEAMEVAGRLDGSPAGSHSGKDDPLLVFGCGRAVAVRTWIVAVGDVSVFLVRRAAGWQTWMRRR